MTVVAFTVGVLECLPGHWGSLLFRLRPISPQRTPDSTRVWLGVRDGTRGGWGEAGVLVCQEAEGRVEGLGVPGKETVTGFLVLPFDEGIEDVVGGELELGLAVPFGPLEVVIGAGAVVLAVKCIDAGAEPA